MNKRTLTLLVTIIIFISTCKSIYKVKDVTDATDAIATTEIKTDTIRAYIYKHSLGLYADSKYDYVWSQDNDGTFYSQGLKGASKRKNVIKSDSNGIRSISFWYDKKVTKRIDVQYDSNGQVKEINNFKSNYRDQDPLLLKSIEKYQYNKRLLTVFEFVDINRIRTQIDSIITRMTHEYDNKDRIIQTIISRRTNLSNSAKVINRRGRKSVFMNIDTVNYFYNGDSALPFKVEKSAFEGTECFINKKPENELEFIRIHKDKYKNNLAVIKTTELFTFDHANRVTEYKKITDVNIPSEVKEIKYKKYIYTYSDNIHLKEAPKMLYYGEFMDAIPTLDPMRYFTSNIEVSQYPDIQIRTDLEFFILPSFIEHSISRNGINWDTKYKLETN